MAPDESGAASDFLLPVRFTTWKASLVFRAWGFRAIASHSRIPLVSPEYR